jgi:hypothetical protein
LQPTDQNIGAKEQVMLQAVEHILNLEIKLEDFNS